MTETGLIADIGGTNARFALTSPGSEPRNAIVLRCDDHAGPAEAALAYLAQVPARPLRAAFAVASPITGDEVDLTNHPWTFSIAEVRQRLGLERLEVVNDFVAVALSVRHLRDGQKLKIGRGEPVPSQPIAVLGPGTGLGVSALVPCSGQWRPLATEGGHVTMAATDDEESEVLAWLRRGYGHVSAERVLSGPGLVNLYLALAGVAGRPPEPLTPDLVSSRGLSGECDLCRRALEMFFAMLGTVAGNLALSVGARGGVYIAGGILPRMTEAFAASAFRRRFEAKGRFDDYLAAIPTWLVTHPYPAFVGLTALVEE